MSSKLTLSINQTVINQAKQYAKDSGKSLSGIVEEYLKSLVNIRPSSTETSKLSVVRELQGSVKIPSEFTTYEELLEDALLAKYLNNE